MLLSLFVRVVYPLYGIGLARIPGFVPIFAFLFRFISPKLIGVHGSKMYMEPHDAVVLSAAALNSFEPFMTEIFKKVVKEGDIVVDLGAHVGYYTLLAAKSVGKQGKVYAFEPHPKSYNLLIKNVELNKYGNIIPVPKAVTNKVGPAKLFVGPDPSWATLYQAEGRRKFIEVETQTLDHFFQDKGDIINVIKIDIEGGEMDALLGMDKLLSQNKNLKMFVEFVPSLSKKAGYSPEEFLNKLWSYNFKVFHINDKKKCLKYINNLNELMAACKYAGVVNLFVTRQPLDNEAI